MENKITKIVAEEIKNSHGAPTIKVTVFVDNISDSFSVPSGASTGIHEAHVLRDPDGLSMTNAVNNVNNKIAPILLGQDVFDQNKIDEMMIKLDGTENKDNLGGNAMIGVSIACVKVAAKVKNQDVYQYLQTLSEIKPSFRKMPYLFMNLLEGGKHTDNGLAFQEYHVVPETEDVQEAVDIGILVQNTLREVIVNDLGGEAPVLGDEGGFAPKTNIIKKPLLYLVEALKRNNLQDKVHLALDVASSSFYDDGLYQIEDKRIFAKDLMNIYDSFISEFKLFSIEDPFDEEDFENFKNLKDNHRGMFVVGDDLTVSNQMLLKKAIESGSINAMIIKPNQIGTLSETLLTMKIARENNIELIVSHRGEETNDDFIADLAYAFKCFGLKAGSPLKSERMIKYQRLMKISHE